MAVQIDGFGAIAAQGTTFTLQLVPPAGSWAGKGLLAWVTSRGSEATISAPAGFGWQTTDQAGVTASHNSRLFWLPNPSGSEDLEDCFLFSSSVQDLMYGFVIRVEGHDAGDFIDAFPIPDEQSGSSTSLTIPGIADGTSQDGALVLQFYSLNNDGARVTGPSQGTLYEQTTTVGSDGALGVVYFNKATAGIVSDTTMTINQTLNKNYTVLALRVGGLDITPPGRGSTIAFGTHSFTTGAVDIEPAGRGSTIAFGTMSLELAPDQNITPSVRTSTFAAGEFELVAGPGPDQEIFLPPSPGSTFAAGVMEFFGGADPGEFVPDPGGFNLVASSRATLQDIRWLPDHDGLQFVERLNVPDSAFMENFWGPVGYIFRRCDVLNSDGSLWRPAVGIISGSVTVDYSRDERRSGDLVLDNIDGDLTIDPEDGLWYDKLIRLWRGIVVDGEAICWRLGTFCIDRMSTNNKTSAISLTLRDQTKKMMLSRFAEATAFAEGTDIATIIRALASNSGIPLVLAPLTGQTLDRDIFFEADTSRWDAAKQIAVDHSLEIFFDCNGVLILRPFVDPTTAPTYVAFNEGENIIDFDRSTDDSRLFNHIVVIGESEDEVIPNYVAEWENTEPTSPTRIARIGRRTYTHKSAFITSQAQADALAASLGAVMALESFNVNFNSVVLPWLDVGNAIDFFPLELDRNPTRYLMVSVTIPLELAPMGVVGNRVTIVG